MYPGRVEPHVLWTAKLQLAVDIFTRFIRQYYAALNGVEVAVSKTTRVFMHVRITTRRRWEAHNTSVPAHLVRQNNMGERVFSFYVINTSYQKLPTRAQGMRWSNSKAIAGHNAYAMLLTLTSGSDTGLLASIEASQLKYGVLGALR